ncbi:MAG: tetratricopeptide repeat protein [Erysipelotrichales bacterium]|nr:tetratricopeptide repeat protein [Erysipelotrichales bacterium]
MNKDTLAFLIYCNRLDSNLTQETFAGDANITRSALVRIEQGQIKNLDDNSIANVLGLIGTSISELDTLNAKLNTLLNQLFMGLINNNISITRTLLETDEICSNHRYIIGDINYLLIKYIYCYKKANTTLFKKIDNVLVKALEFMTHEQLFIYYDIKGVFHLNNKEFNLARDYFLQAQYHCTNDYHKSLIKFHLGKSYINTDDFFNAMESYNAAIDLFSRTLNYQKLLYAKMDIAGIYVRIGDYEKALENYQLVLDSAFSIKADDTLIASIKRNIAALHMYQGDYETAITAAESSFVYSKESSIAYFQIVFSYYMLNDLSKAKYWISQAEDNSVDTTSMEMKMIRLINKVILKKKDAIDSLIAFLEKNSFTVNKRYKTIILYLIIEYYLYEAEDLVKANEYYAILGQTLSSVKVFDKIMKIKA